MFELGQFTHLGGCFAFFSGHGVLGRAKPLCTWGWERVFHSLERASSVG